MIYSSILSFAFLRSPLIHIYRLLSSPLFLSFLVVSHLSLSILSSSPLLPVPSLCVSPFLSSPVSFACPLLSYFLSLLCPLYLLPLLFLPSFLSFTLSYSYFVSSSSKFFSFLPTSHLFPPLLSLLVCTHSSLLSSSPMFIFCFLSSPTFFLSALLCLSSSALGACECNDKTT